MTTRKQRDRLRPVHEIDALFGSVVLRKLGSIARVPDAKVDAFGRALRQCVKTYLEEAMQPDASAIRTEIAALARATDSAISGDALVDTVVSALQRLSTSSRHILERNAAATLRRVPTQEDIANSRISRDALRFLSGLCVEGALISPGRRRPNDKRSCSTLKVQFSGPNIRRHRPTDILELILCASIGQAYLDATGLNPVRWRHERNRGPFVRLLKEVFILLDLRDTVSPDDLARRYAARVKAPSAEI